MVNTSDLHTGGVKLQYLHVLIFITSIICWYHKCMRICLISFIYIMSLLSLSTKTIFFYNDNKANEKKNILFNLWYLISVRQWWDKEETEKEYKFNIKILLVNKYLLILRPQKGCRGWYLITPAVKPVIFNLKKWLFFLKKISARVFFSSYTWHQLSIWF